MLLKTKRLLLREMKPEDYEALFRVLGDPETMWHYPYTFDGQHVKDWIARNMKRYRKDGFGLWAVCLKDTGEIIGDCGLTLQKALGMDNSSNCSGWQYKGMLLWKERAA